MAKTRSRSRSGSRSRPHAGRSRAQQIRREHPAIKRQRVARARADTEKARTEAAAARAATRALRAAEWARRRSQAGILLAGCVTATRAVKSGAQWAAPHVAATGRRAGHGAVRVARAAGWVPSTPIRARLQQLRDDIAEHGWGATLVTDWTSPHLGRLHHGDVDAHLGRHAAAAGHAVEWQARPNAAAALANAVDPAGLPEGEKPGVFAAFSTWRSRRRRLDAAAFSRDIDEQLAAIEQQRQDKVKRAKLARLRSRSAEPVDQPTREPLDQPTREPLDEPITMLPADELAEWRRSRARSRSESTESTESAHTADPAGAAGGHVIEFRPRPVIGGRIRTMSSPSNLSLQSLDELLNPDWSQKNFQEDVPDWLDQVHAVVERFAIAFEELHELGAKVQLPQGTRQKLELVADSASELPANTGAMARELRALFESYEIPKLEQG